MLEFRTPGFKGFSTKFSPFYDSRMAVATGQNFGLVGNGRLYILGLGERGIAMEKFFDTQDTLYDLAWSESHENQIITANGDGTIKLFDIGLNQFPIQQWQAHGREVFSVHWDLVQKDRFLSSSWEGSVKVWAPGRDDTLAVLPTHTCTYSAQFCPHEPGICSAVSADGHLRIWDLRTPASASNHLMMDVPVRASNPNLPPIELLTHDWNKYRNTIVAVGGTDGEVKTFDLRNPNQPFRVMPGHTYAVKKVSWSPHFADVLVSASYDMSCGIFKHGDPPEQSGYKMGSMDGHTEFCTGVDWSLFGMEGWLSSTAWDERVLVWDFKNFIKTT